MFSQSSKCCCCLLSHSRNQEMSVLIWCLSFFYSFAPFLHHTQCTRSSKLMLFEWAKQKRRKKKLAGAEKERRGKNKRATKQIIYTYVFVDLFARQSPQKDAQKKGKIARRAFGFSFLRSICTVALVCAYPKCSSTCYICQNEFLYSVAWNVFVFSGFIPIYYIVLNILFLNQSLLQSPAACVESDREHVKQVSNLMYSHGVESVRI